MIKLVKADGQAENRQIAQMRTRAAEAGDEVARTAVAIMAAVRDRGYAAVEEYSLRFDRATPREIPQQELEAARRACPPALIAALERAAEHIRAYNQRLLPQSWETGGGALVGQLVRPLSRVGIYVPGGTAAYPSSVLMNAVPAKVAGVPELVMVTPPGDHLKPAVLAAAHIAGVDRVLAVGGAQAVAALTYGAGFIPRVDKITGPGNAYVAAAKRIAFGQVDIDMIAGPSEILVIADDSVPPAWVAADLLSQAEHDKLASAVLLTFREETALAVIEELRRQTALLPRADIITQSLRDFGCAIVCASEAQAAEIADTMAPEHLEIMTREPRRLLALIHNAGAVFLGAYSPEPLGDYMAGPNHVLPTSGTARFFSPLSCEDFLKKMSVIEYDRPSLERVRDDVEALAAEEGLAAHKNAVAQRFAQKGEPT